VHHIARPREAIVEALNTIEKSWELANPKPQIILCHIATADEIEWVKRMRAKGARVAAETCAHYILLTQDDYLKQGNIYKVNPPLRQESDQQALCEALRDGTVDFLCTDHAPHLPEEKNSANPPSGIAGIEWYYPLALFIAQKLNLSYQRLQQLVCQNAARTLGITHRSGIVPGNFADLVLIEKTPNPQSKVVTRAATRPFAQFALEHIVRHVFVNGNLVLENGNLNAEHLGFEVPHAN
jgi:dihydroorotase